MQGFFYLVIVLEKKIKNYFEKRFNQQKKGGWKNTDNGILNESIYIDKEFEINFLNKKWNYMPHLCNEIDETKPNFLHFIGGLGKDYIKQLYDESSDVQIFWKSYIGDSLIQFIIINHKNIKKKHFLKKFKFKRFCNFKNFLFF